MVLERLHTLFEEDPQVSQSQVRIAELEQLVGRQAYELEILTRGENGKCWILAAWFSEVRQGAAFPMAPTVRRLYDDRKEGAMIELTEEQMQALNTPDATLPRVVNSRTNETFVLLRVDEYERLTQEEYDDSPWTREELQALAWERIKHQDWDEYENLPEKP